METLFKVGRLYNGETVNVQETTDEMWKLIQYDHFLPSRHENAVTFVSTHGRFMRATGEIQDSNNHSVNREGYKQVSINRPCKTHTVTVHRVVCWTFHGPPPSQDHSVDHKNGNRSDNRLENLHWVTPYEQYANRGIVSFNRLKPGEKRVLRNPPKGPIKPYRRTEKMSINERAFSDYVSEPESTVESLAEYYRKAGHCSSTVKDNSVRSYIARWTHDLLLIGKLDSNLTNTLLAKLRVPCDALVHVKSCLDTTKELKKIIGRDLLPEESEEFNTFLHNKVEQFAPECTDKVLLLQLSYTLREALGF